MEGLDEEIYKNCPHNNDIIQSSFQVHRLHSICDETFHACPNPDDERTGGFRFIIYQEQNETIGPSNTD